MNIHYIIKNKLFLYVFLIVLFSGIKVSGASENSFRCENKIIEEGMMLEVAKEECSYLVDQGEVVKTATEKCGINTRNEIKRQVKKEFNERYRHVGEEERKKAKTYSDRELQRELRQCEEEISRTYDFYVYKEKGSFIRYLYFNLGGTLAIIKTSSDRAED